MSELVVPDFLKFEDFGKWIEGLSEKEIQSWTTKDWNKIFEKLTKYADFSKEFEKIYQEELARKVENFGLPFSKSELFMDLKGNNEAFIKYAKSVSDGAIETFAQGLTETQVATEEIETAGAVKIAEDSGIKFRGWDVEKAQIAQYNKEAASRILEQAGILPDNPNFQRYEALTRANVHTFRRFGVYDETAEQEIINALKNKEINVDIYAEITKQFKNREVLKQQQNAIGTTSGSLESTTYEALKYKQKKTITEGLNIRQRENPTYPEAFAQNDRLVVEIEQGNSAWNMVNNYAERHQDIGLQFDGEAFVIDDTRSSPGKFFNGRAKKIDKFLQNNASIDMADRELFSLVEQNDFEGFLELNKTRGMAGNQQNSALRQLIKNDKDLFKEVGMLIGQANGQEQEIIGQMQALSNEMKARANLVHEETLASALHRPKGQIDRIMFSVAPADLAKQSTFQDWKSCMHAVGKYNREVPNTIGYGTIIAYGYDSENPSKMISRVLIHPYENEKGETIYRVNNKIYGENNFAFKEMVENVVENKFNNPEFEGVFSRPKQIYPDGNSEQVIRLNVKEGETIDIFEKGAVVNCGNTDFSKAKSIILKDNMTLENITSWPETIQYKDVKSIKLKGKCSFPKDFKFPKEVILDNVQVTGTMDLSSSENVRLLNTEKLPEDIILPKNVEVFENIPRNADFSKCENMTIFGVSKAPEGVRYAKNVTIGNGFPPGLDLSACEHVTIDWYVNDQLLNNIKLPSDITFTQMPKDADLTAFESVTFKNVEFFDDVKLPKNVILEGGIPEGCNFEACESITLKNVKELPANIKLPKEVKTIDCSMSVAMKCQAHKVKHTIQQMAKTAQKTTVKFSMKSVEATAKNTAKKSGEALLSANRAYDAMFDRNVERLMKMDAPQWMKSIDNAMAKPLNMTAEQLQKAAEAFMKTETGQKIAAKVTASYAKVGGKAIAASAAKKIPLACVGIACAMAKERYENGEYVKAGLEVVSGVAACVPVFGTAVSLGIDGAVLLSDLKIFEHQAVQADPNSHMAAESTAVYNPYQKAEEMQARLVKSVAEHKEVKETVKKNQKEPPKLTVNNIRATVLWERDR